MEMDGQNTVRIHMAGERLVDGRPSDAIDSSDPEASLYQQEKEEGSSRNNTKRTTLIALGVVCLVLIIVALSAVMKRGETAPPQAPVRESKLSFKGATQVYLGNGCFWERQYAYVNIEMSCDFEPKPTRAACTPFNRPKENVTAKVGYAGGSSNDGLACYHHSGDHSDGTLYEDLGHAEAVSVELEAGKEQEQFAAILTDFFDSFNPKDGGMERPDPGDRGSPYRSLIGIPGGVNGELYALVVSHNIHKMVLKPGTGNEDDVFNQVWIMDSDTFPFHRGEQYHQFHSNFFGEDYPSHYWDDLWKLHVNLDTIPPTGCPEGSHW